MRIARAALLTALIAAVMLLHSASGALYPAAQAYAPDAAAADTTAYCQLMSPWFPYELQWAQQQAELLKSDLKHQKSALEQTLALSGGNAGADKEEKKYVYLTFDDGPSDITPRVLEILRQNNIKATFFVVYHSNADYYRQIAAGGHTIGLHSYTHNYARIYSDDKAFFADLNQISDYVKSITGVQSKIMRFAGGSSNTVSRRYNTGIMSRLVKEVEERGYVYFDWNAQCMEAVKRCTSPNEILRNVESYTCSGGNERPYINLLLHNSATEGATADALQSIIDYYRGLGYEFRPITPDTPAIHQRVQN